MRSFFFVWLLHGGFFLRDKLALAEYQMAQVDLAFVTGTLLGAAKVRWDPIVPTTSTTIENRN